MKYELDLYDKWREGRAEGIKEGIEQGLTQGRQEGIEIGEERGIAKGREEGIQQGKEESAIKTAITLLQFGDYSVEKIAECTNLSVETVKKLAK